MSSENDPELQKMTTQVCVCVLEGDENGLERGEDERIILFVQDRLAFQRQQLHQRLGLCAQGKVFSTGMEDLFDDNDLVTHVVPNSGTGQEHSTVGNSKVCMCGPFCCVHMVLACHTSKPVLPVKLV